MDIELQGVSFAYPSGTTVLDGLDLVIQGGGAVALVGANGSGKTTLARLLNGLLRPTLGRVLLDGADIATRRVADLAASVAVGFQDPDRQVFSRSVRAEVEFGPRRLGFPAERRERAVAEALVATGLADFFDIHPHDLGESRRMLLGLASLLAMETAVLVLDEPTVGLDPAGEARVAGVVATLLAAARSVIVISHDMRFVAETCERIVVLEHGRVVLDGSPADVFAEDSWPILRRAGLEPPEAARLGARLGLGSTPTESALVAAARVRSQIATA
jgi:energy-coupling factor transport system ATP-binding protein